MAIGALLIAGLPWGAMGSGAEKVGNGGARCWERVDTHRHAGGVRDDGRGSAARNRPRVFDGDASLESKMRAPRNVMSRRLTDRFG